MTDTGKIIAVTIVVLVLLGGTAVAMPTHGLRNNNPGNLRPLGGGQKWNGQTGVDGGGYLTFDTLANGVRAASINLAHYTTRDGIDNIATMAARWAPASDNNDPLSYAATVASVSGYGVGDALDFSDPTINAAVLKGIFTAENGAANVALYIPKIVAA